MSYIDTPTLDFIVPGERCSSSKDIQGNTIYSLIDRPPVHTVLLGIRPQEVYVSSAAPDLAKAAWQGYRIDPTYFHYGRDGYVYLVRDLDQQPQYVLKSLVEPGSALMGVEQYLLSTHMQPIFSAHDFNLNPVLLGADSRIITPYINGGQVRTLIRERMDEHHKEISKSLRQKTLPLHEHVADALGRLFKSWGLQFQFDTDMLEDGGRQVYASQTCSEITLMVDFHPTRNSKSDRYRNWVIPFDWQEHCVQAYQQGDLRDVIRSIMYSMVCVDPILVRGIQKEQISFDN